MNTMREKERMIGKKVNGIQLKIQGWCSKEISRQEIKAWSHYYAC